jgi:hypothetical protein
MSRPRPAAHVDARSPRQATIAILPLLPYSALRTPQRTRSTHSLMFLIESTVSDRPLLCYSGALAPVVGVLASFLSGFSSIRTSSLVSSSWWRSSSRFRPAAVVGSFRLGARSRSWHEVIGAECHLVFQHSIRWSVVGNLHSDPWWILAGLSPAATPFDKVLRSRLLVAARSACLVLPLTCRGGEGGEH